MPKKINKDDEILELICELDSLKEFLTLNCPIYCIYEKDGKLGKHTSRAKTNVCQAIGKYGKPIFVASLYNGTKISFDQRMNDVLSTSSLSLDIKNKDKILKKCKQISSEHNYMCFTF